jgi:hypothetical protein
MTWERQLSAKNVCVDRWVWPANDNVWQRFVGAQRAPDSRRARARADRWARPRLGIREPDAARLALVGSRVWVANGFAQFNGSGPQKEKGFRFFQNEFPFNADFDRKIGKNI